MKVAFCGYGRSGKECLMQLLLRDDCRSDDVIVFGHANDQDLVDFARSLRMQVIDKSINQCREVLLGFQPDYIISAYYRYIIKDEILETANFKSMNLHPALLPDYKGCFSSVWAILNGETMTGVTFHYITNEVDTGNILLQKAIPISGTETAFSLYHKLVSLFVVNFNTALDLLKQGYPGIRQDRDEKYRYYPRKVPFEGVLKAHETRFEFAQKFVRAMYFPPFEGAKFIIDSHEVEITDVGDLEPYKDKFLA